MAVTLYSSHILFNKCALKPDQPAPIVGGVWGGREGTLCPAAASPASSACPALTHRRGQLRGAASSGRPPQGGAPPPSTAQSALLLLVRIGLRCRHHEPLHELPGAPGRAHLARAAVRGVPPRERLLDVQASPGPRRLPARPAVHPPAHLPPLPPPPAPDLSNGPEPENKHHFVINRGNVRTLSGDMGWPHQMMWTSSWMSLTVLRRPKDPPEAEAG